MGLLMGHPGKTTFSRVAGQKGPELIKKNEEQEKRKIKTFGLRAQARWTWSVARPLDNLARSPRTYFAPDNSSARDEMYPVEY